MTDAITAISGTRRQARELVDGTIEVKIHRPIQGAIHALFPRSTCPSQGACNQTLSPAMRHRKRKGGKEESHTASRHHCDKADFHNPKVLAVIGSINNI